MSTFSRVITSLAIVILCSHVSNGFRASLRVSNPSRVLLVGRLSHGESDNSPSNYRSEEIKGLGNMLKFVATGLTLGSLTSIPSAKAAEVVPKISFKPLPYDYKALMPYISEETLKFHHDKHHGKYVATTLSMIKGTDLDNADLVSVMQNSRGIAPVLFNNAAQSWNHEFYWSCMKKGGGGVPTGKAGAAITENFGSYDAFKSQVSYEQGRSEREG